MNNCSNKDGVPVFDTVPKTERYSRLDELFQKEFEDSPSFYVRVPGRVNIIGEHIDYCGYPVLPMALEQDILMAVGVIEDLNLHLRNSNSKYEKHDYILKSFEEINISPDENGKPYWYNYILCGIKGAIENMNNKIYNGLQIYVDGNIPPASGLSSSSALVSASCLSFLYAQNKVISKAEIASLCANSERYIGTQGGGMDQAIAFLAEKYCAQYITWNPLKATAVVLPEDAAFVVAHSLAEANKAATNDFNRRVIECRLAAKILSSNSKIISTNKILTLSEVQHLCSKNLEEMVELVEKTLPKDFYTKEDISILLDISQEELEDIYFTSNTKHLNELKLKQRALHVFNEAIRVENFRNTCLNFIENINTRNGTNGSIGDIIDKKPTLSCLGKLMSESHMSLRDLYECSHKNLDILVEISQKLGVHCRLTGAGWGGCVVALCQKNKVNEYIELLKKEFYENHCNLDKNKCDNYVFATTPNYGACIYDNRKVLVS